MPKPTHARARLWARVVLWTVFVLLVAFIGACFLGPELLEVERPVARADVIVLLGGEPRVRHAKAAELYHAGVAPRLLVTGAGDAESLAEKIVEAGVPRAALIMEPRARSTWENAQFARQLLTNEPPREILLVTSWYHCRRARATFEAVFPGAEVYCVGASTPWERHNQRRQWGYNTVQDEYMKLLWYWLRHGVFPFVGRSAPSAGVPGSTTLPPSNAPVILRP